MNEEKKQSENNQTEEETENTANIEKQKQAYDIVSETLRTNDESKEVSVDDSVLDEILTQREQEDTSEKSENLSENNIQSDSSVLADWQKIDDQEAKKKKRSDFVWEPQPGQNYLSFSLICGGASILFLYMDYGFIFSLLCAVSGIILADTARKKGYKGQIRLISLIVSILVLVYDTASLALMVLV